MRLFGRRRGRRSRSGPKGRLARRLIRSAAGLLFAFYAFCTLSLWILRSMNPLWTSVQLQHRIEAFVAGEDYAKRQTFVLLDRIPLELQHAVIAAEDGAFYRHQGIDWAEIKLLADEIRGGGRVRGASTISQQLVKNLFLTTHRSIVRKAFEFTLVPIAELILGKPRILELYLNVIELGDPAFMERKKRRAITTASPSPNSAATRPPVWPPASLRLAFGSPSARIATAEKS